MRRGQGPIRPEVKTIPLAASLVSCHTQSSVEEDETSSKNHRQQVVKTLLTYIITSELL